VPTTILEYIDRSFSRVWTFESPGEAIDTREPSTTIGYGRPMGDEHTVVELTAEQTHPLRLDVLRADTPSRAVVFTEDGWPGTLHLGVREGDDIVAISTWIPRQFGDEPAVQLRGMATAAHIRGRGLGSLLLAAGCERAASMAPLVWARARDTALGFYLHHGFSIEGAGFVDEQTQKPHHIILRRFP
jgi:GNAT superfamily N-acetyltransferase